MTTRNELRYYELYARAICTVMTLTPEQKTSASAEEVWLHEPPHFHQRRLVSDRCEHKRYFQAEEDQAWLLGELLKELQVVKITIGGWVVLPNHYHLLVQCQPLSVISQPLRRVHARTARALNRCEGVSGRKVWHLFSDRQIRSERHYYTTLNYIHYNPTKHDYVQRPLDWACSSLHWYQKHFGVEWLRSHLSCAGLWKDRDWFGSVSS